MSPLEGRAFPRALPRPPPYGAVAGQRSARAWSMCALGVTALAVAEVRRLHVQLVPSSTRANNPYRSVQHANCRGLTGTGAIGRGNQELAAATRDWKQERAHSHAATACFTLHRLKPHAHAHARKRTEKTHACTRISALTVHNTHVRTNPRLCGGHTGCMAVVRWPVVKMPAHHTTTRRGGSLYFYVDFLRVHRDINSHI